MSLCKCFQINVIGETSGFLLLRENWEESGKTPLQKVQQSAFDPPPSVSFSIIVHYKFFRRVFMSKNMNETL